MKVILLVVCCLAVGPVLSDTIMFLMFNYSKDDKPTAVLVIGSCTNIKIENKVLSDSGYTFKANQIISDVIPEKFGESFGLTDWADSQKIQINLLKSGKKPSFSEMWPEPGTYTLPPNASSLTLGKEFGKLWKPSSETTLVKLNEMFMVFSQQKQCPLKYIIGMSEPVSEVAFLFSSDVLKLTTRVFTNLGNMVINYPSIEHLSMPYLGIFPDNSKDLGTQKNVLRILNAAAFRKLGQKLQYSTGYKEEQIKEPGSNDKQVSMYLVSENNEALASIPLLNKPLSIKVFVNGYLDASHRLELGSQKEFGVKEEVQREVPHFVCAKYSSVNVSLLKNDKDLYAYKIDITSGKIGRVLVA